MTIIASCGHELSDGDEGVDVIYGGEDCDAVDGFLPCVFYSHFCTACADDWCQTGQLFQSINEANDWLSNEMKKRAHKRAHL